MIDIKIYRPEVGGKVCKVVVPSPRNMYKCCIWDRGFVQIDQITTGYATDKTSNVVETLLESKEDLEVLVTALTALWDPRVTTLEFHERIPGTFFKADGQAHLILRREGRNLYCITLEGKKTFKIPNKDYVFEEEPTFEEIRYLWENINAYL